MNKETEMKKLIVICCGLVVGFALLAGLYYADEVEAINTFDPDWGASWTPSPQVIADVCHGRCVSHCDALLGYCRASSGRMVGGNIRCHYRCGWLL